MLENSDLERAKAIFLSALTLEAAEREPFVRREADGDTRLFDFLMGLLAASPPSVLRTGGAGVAFDHTRSTENWPSAISGDYVGSYILHEKIGEGGFGEVWLAEQDNPVRPRVALKLLRLGLSTREVQRFEAERTTLVRLNHPGIAKVFDGSCTDEGRPYLVMEYVPGLPITDHCDASRLTISQRISLFFQVCRAVQHAHQKGVIHRDLKPQNIIVSSIDGQPVAKVIDFGIARQIVLDPTNTRSLTLSGTILGTLRYMPPEQAATAMDGVDVRADVYALGVVLHELVTGAVPVDFADFDEAKQRVSDYIQNTPTPRPSEHLTLRMKHDTETRAALDRRASERGAELTALHQAVRGDLDLILLKAISKDRENRYASVADFAEDLRRCMSGYPVSAAPPSLFYRTRRFLGRHRALTGTTLLLLIALFVAGFAIRRTAEHALRAELAETKLMGHEAGADEVTQLLQAMIDGARPGIALGRDSSVLEQALTVARVRLRSGSMSAAPKAQFKLRLTLAAAMRELASYVEAGEILEPARQLAETEFGFNSHEMANFLREYATLLKVQGHYPHALASSQSGLAIRRQLVTADDSRLAADMAGVADLLADSAQLEPALYLHRDSLAMRRRLYPNGHGEVVAGLSHMFHCLTELGQFEEALACIEEALAMQRRLPAAPGSELSLAKLLNDVAAALSTTARQPEALALQAEAFECFVRVHQTDHPNLIRAYSNYASSLHDVGRLDEALPKYEVAFEIANRLHPNDHVDKVLCMNSLASGREAIGECEKALQLYDDALSMYRRLGLDNPRTIVSFLNNSAGCLVRLGRSKEAAAKFQQALQFSADQLPNVFAARLRSNFGWCLTGLGQYPEAERLLLEGQNYYDSSRDLPLTHHRENVTRLVELYNAWSSTEEAAMASAQKWKLRLVQVEEAASTTEDTAK